MVRTRASADSSFIRIDVTVHLASITWKDWKVRSWQILGMTTQGNKAVVF